MGREIGAYLLYEFDKAIGEGCEDVEEQEPGTRKG